MNYNEFINFTKRIDYDFHFDEIVKACEAINKISFKYIPINDHEIIEEFFDRALLTKNVPQEYVIEIKALIDNINA